MNVMGLKTPTIVSIPLCDKEYEKVYDNGKLPGSSTHPTEDNLKVVCNPYPIVGTEKMSPF
jgi:hypothetical protein